MSRKRHFLIAGIFMFFLAALVPLIAAQDDIQIDPEVAMEILQFGVFGGFGVIAVTELLKRLLKTTGALSVLVSIVVAIVITGAYLLLKGQFDILTFLGYSIATSAAANGIYLFPKSRNE